MSEYIKRQDAIDTVGQSYKYESDRMTALQELPVMNIQSVEERQNTHIVIKKEDALKYLTEVEYLFDKSRKLHIEKLLPSPYKFYTQAKYIKTQLKNI